MAALQIELTDDDVTQIEEVMPKGAAEGLRYSEEAMATVNR